jgi:hypothetical protein
VRVQVERILWRRVLGPRASRTPEAPLNS